MKNSLPLSTLIDSEVKSALQNYCKKKGLKIQYVIEKALLDLLEDEIDSDAYIARKNETSVSFNEVLKKSKIKAR